MPIVNTLLQLKDDIKHVKEKQFQKERRRIYLEIAGVSSPTELHLCIIENNWYPCNSGGFSELNCNYFVCPPTRHLTPTFYEILTI